MEQSTFLRVGDVAVITGYSVREVWRHAASDKTFPKPRKLSTRRTVWLRSEVERWAAKKVKELEAVR